MNYSESLDFLAGVNYKTAGNGQALVLIHGFCESHEIFSGLIPALANDCRVLIPDLPGHGKSPWGKGLRSLDDAACWLRDLLDALEIDQCVLAGHSLGGYIALAFADRFPDRLTGLGLIHSTALADTRQRRLNRTKSVEFIRKYGKNEFLKVFVPSLFANPSPIWLETMAAITAQTDEAAILTFTQSMRDRPDRRQTVRSLTIPVTYITGEKDGLLSPERTREELQELPMALLHRIPEASHMGMFESPERVTAALRSLMELSAASN